MIPYICNLPSSHTDPQGGWEPLEMRNGKDWNPVLRKPDPIQTFSFPPSPPLPMVHLKYYYVAWFPMAPITAKSAGMAFKYL